MTKAPCADHTSGKQHISEGSAHMARAVPQSNRKHGAGMVPPHVDGSDGSEPPPCRKLRDPDVMFPVPGGKWKTKDAKAVCRRCPLDKLSACREWALESRQEFGVWGGMSQGERKKELKRRGGAPAEEIEPEALAA